MTLTYPTKIGDEAELTRDEWLAIRQTGIGGSDAAAVLGLNPWASTYSLWAEKTTEPRSIPETDAMRFGTMMEPHLRRLYSDVTGHEVIEDTAIYRHPEHDFMLANLDGVILDDFTGEPAAVLEIKTSANPKAWEQGIPEHYRLQVLHYLAVTGLPRGVVAVLLRGEEFRTFDVEPMEGELDALIDAEARFWDWVKTGAQPEVDGSQATRDTLTKRFEPDGSTIDLPEEFDALFTKRAELKAEADELAEQIKTLEARIMATLGDAEIGMIAGEKAVTWKPQSRTTVDTKALKAEMPEVAEKFSKTSTTRVLRITR